MKGELCFCLVLDYTRTQYAPLLSLAVHRPVYKENEGYLWVFRYRDIRAVETTFGASVEIPEYRDRFEREDVEIPEFKGVDFVEVKEPPKIYQIIEHRKQDDFSIKIIKHQIPRELVKTIWEGIIVHMPLDKPVKTSTMAEKICDLLRIDRFHRQTGTFDFAKFFGERRDYYTYFYLPMKVLAHQGKIKHHKSGKVERILP